MEIELKCIICQSSLQSSWNFCPNCGKVLHDFPPSTSLSRQLVIYFISFFLPPFGLGYAFRYLKRKERKVKLVGFVVVILTIVSLIMTMIALKALLDSYSIILNNLGTGNYP